MPDAPLLVQELGEFRTTVKAASDETAESWRENPHDDLVFAVTLVAWTGERALSPLLEPPEEPAPTLLVP